MADPRYKLKGSEGYYELIERSSEDVVARLYKRTKHYNLRRAFVIRWWDLTIPGIPGSTEHDTRTAAVAAAIEWFDQQKEAVNV